jgi:hypothetical protein
MLYPIVDIQLVLALSGRPAAHERKPFEPILVGHLGGARAWSHRRCVLRLIRFISDSLIYLVTLFLKR